MIITGKQVIYMIRMIAIIPMINTIIIMSMIINQNDNTNDNNNPIRFNIYI